MRRITRSAGSVAGLRAEALGSRSGQRLNGEADDARRMYAACPASIATRATARDEESRGEACICGCRPSVVRTDAVGDVAEPRSERESRCLPLPRVALGILGRCSGDSLHRSGLRVLLPSAPGRASSSKQAPRGLRPIVEGWRLIATRV